MATGQDLISETKRHLFTGSREQLNRIAVAINTSDSALTFTYELGGIQVGSMIEMELELMYVWAVTASSKTAVVERAQLGTTAATHAINTIVTVNPKFPTFSIFKALNEEISDLSSPLNGLFQMKGMNITYNSARSGYDLTAVTDVLDIYEIQYESASGDLNWPELTQWKLSRNMDTSEFASGMSLTFYEGADPGRILRVRYKAPFVQMTTPADDVTTITGLHAEALDIPPMGAAARLVAPREVKRGFMEHQGEPRRAEEVPGGQNLRASQGLLALRRQRIQAEAARLYQRYPARLKVAR